MFKKAIKDNLECVKAISTAYKTPYQDELVTSMFSIVLINDDGWALTTKQIANNIVVADKLHGVYEDIKKELIENRVPPKKIYKKYGLKEDSAMILKNVFLNTLTSWSGMKILAHDYLDLALIKFEEPKGILCKKFPIFALDNPVQGESLCRLGYPYPEFKAFKYDHATKDIILNDLIDNGLQVMPLDGMLTRNLLDESGNMSLFELSGNSLMGQIGGPVINTKGEIVGLKVGTAYKDPEFDIKSSIKRKLKEVNVEQYNFVPLSLCANVNTLKKFMDDNKVKYNTKK